ncbi:hypothetical protein GCM10027060_11010 [Nesterenkonia halophila]|uniref:lipoprotein intramolecular transacylase Lit n=1 Tax=Nesterenkonia halophila TaxID=302044 RepID=UPI0012913FD5|nr:DUF1461 domain-containing protein [Nesterenkonia halophila]
MSANSQRPEHGEPQDTGGGFESGLDYGAFAEDAPDYPEDRPDAATPQEPEEGSPEAADDAGAAPTSDDETTETAGRAAAAGEQPTEPIGGASAPRAEDQPTAAMPRTAASDDATRPLGDVATEATGGQSEGSSQAGSASTPAPAPAMDTEPAPAPAMDTEPAPAPAVDTEPAPGAQPASGGADEQETATLSAAREPQPSEASRDLPYEPAAAGAAGAAGGSAVVGRTAADEAITDQDLDEEVAKDKRGASRLLQVLLAIFVPLLVLAAAVRLVASPLFVWLEYRLPHFPADELGFGTDDRTLYGSYGVDYLFNGADSRYLSELAVEGGPLFTEAEVGHMADVKRVMLIGMAVAAVLLIVTLIFVLLLRRWRPGAVARGFFSAAWVALVLVAALVTLAVLGWQDFFSGVHGVLFAEGSWQFPADSTLIRLYPGQFWMDAAIGVGGLMVLIALLLLIITWPTKKRRARRRARLEEVQEARREKLVAELTKDAEYSNAARG